MNALAGLLAQPDNAIGLAEGALLIARSEYPALDVNSYLRRLDHLAERVWGDLAAHERPYNLVQSLNRVLFEEEGFVGNRQPYEDPRNYFLNEVLDRKEGIPLTLSIVYLEVGKRLGLPLEGVPFPGHFLVKLALDEHNLIILDPFSRGLPLSEEVLRQRLERGQGRVGRAQLAQALRSAGPRDILLRLLRNLREVHLRHEQWGKLLAVLTQILVVRPDLAEDWRDRGALYQHLECSQAALGDFRHYLALQPEAEDAEVVQLRIAELEQAVKHLH